MMLLWERFQSEQPGSHCRNHTWQEVMEQLAGFHSRLRSQEFRCDEMSANRIQTFPAHMGKAHKPRPTTLDEWRPGQWPSLGVGWPSAGNALLHHDHQTQPGPMINRKSKQANNSVLISDGETDAFWTTESTWSNCVEKVRSIWYN